MKRIQYKNKIRGFSLVEMTVVLIILGFVLGALLLPLQAQRSQALQLQTGNTLEQAKRALIGFAVSQGRLPCPATAAGNTDAGSRGLENPMPATGICNVTAGYLPAATLGIQPTDNFGFALDELNNRIRYAVTQANNGGLATPDFTTANDMNNVGVSALAPNLKICSDASVANCSANNYLTKDAVAVILSTGANFGISAGADEAANIAATNTFYSRAPTAAGSSNGEFDDMVTWISPYLLYNAMIEAGQLH